MAQAKRAAVRTRRRGTGPGYSDTIAREIIERVAGGETLQAICSEAHMPARQRVYDWLKDEALVEFGQAYARARIDQTHSFVDEALGVARGRMTNKTAYPSKVRIDTLLSVAARMNPAQFSERFNAASVAGDKITVHNVISLTPPQATASAKVADDRRLIEQDSQSLSRTETPDIRE